MSRCGIVWPEEHLSLETCDQALDLLNNLMTEINRFYYLGGGKFNTVIQDPFRDSHEILDNLRQLFKEKHTEEVSDNDHQANSHCSSSSREAVSG